MDCKRISRYSTLVVLFLVTLVNAQNSGGRKRDLNNLYQVIYYGDSQVEVGQPFSISCIISIANPVEWHKDGEPIRKHSNIRHGKDEHSYIESEMGIAGNRDKIEASISVQRALPKHQGKYQCNSVYKNYHQLYVVGGGHSGGGGGGGASASSSSTVTGSSAHVHSEGGMQPLTPSTVKSTLTAPVSIEHHHLFTTAVALAPGPAAVDEEFPGGPLERERERVESPKTSSAGGHSPHHHRQQATSVGHRHHATGNSAGVGGGKDDSKRFVSQKTTIEQDSLLPEEVLEQDFGAMAPPVKHADKTTTSIGHGSATAGGGGKLAKHPKQPPPPLLDTREDDEEDEEALVPTDSEDPNMQEILNLNAQQENLVEPDTEIVIESKAISLEDDNIDRLIQNKSDINGIILVDSLEEMARKSLEGLEEDSTPLLLPPLLPTTVGTMIRIGNVSASAATATAVQSPWKEGSTALATVASPGGEQENTAHHHHHHHHEHHTTTTTTTTTTTVMAAAATSATTSTVTATAPSTTTTSTTSATTTTVATLATTAAEFLKPNYDHAGTSLKVFDIAKALTLGCNITQEGNYELSWAKDGKNVSEVESLKDRYKILPAERKFIISRALESDAGQYTCSVTQLGVSRSFNVVANVVVKFESTEIGKTNIVEGERLTLHCIAYGTDPKISWIVGNNTLNASTDHIVLEEDERGVENAKLIIESITLDDYADYTCTARNNATEFTGKPAQVMMTVRVRGKYAALYVFLGIIVEVVLLCAIILICEKRRNKTEIEESDTDQSPDQNKNGYHGEGEKPPEITTNDKSSTIIRSNPPRSRSQK